MGNRVAVVVGGSEGIGKESLIGFAQEGYDVVCLARNSEKMEVNREEIETYGGKYLAVVADITDENAINEGFGQIFDVFDRIDVLVCCAGGSMGVNAPVDQLDPEFFDMIIRFNMRSVFLCCKQALPVMKKQMYGRIIIVGSGAGRGRSLQGSAAYVAAKAGVIGFTRHASKDLGPYNITINCVASGLVLTDRVKVYWNEIRTPEERESILAITPVGRVGEPLDIARAINFLANEESGYITGAVFDVNGGTWVG